MKAVSKSCRDKKRIKIGKVSAKQIIKKDKTNEYKELNAPKKSLEKIRASLIELKAEKQKTVELFASLNSFSMLRLHCQANKSVATVFAHRRQSQALHETWDGQCLSMPAHAGESSYQTDSPHRIPLLRNAHRHEW